MTTTDFEIIIFAVAFVIMLILIVLVLNDDKETARNTANVFGVGEEVQP